MLSLRPPNGKQTAVETRVDLFYPPSRTEGTLQGFPSIMVITRSMTRALSKDRLSALPDDLILNHIMRKMSYRDLVRSSSLSRRWQFLCRKISVLKFWPEDFEKQQDGDIEAIINYALEHLDGRLRLLEIDVGLDDPRTVDLNYWITLAAEKQVKQMRVHNLYKNTKVEIGESDMVEIGDSLFSCENLTALTLNSVNFPKIPSNFRVFRFLRTFYCKGIANMDDAMLEGFIKLCPHLRNLGIRACLELTKLNIHSSNLMHLSIGYLSRDFSLQIDCPMLKEISLMDVEQYTGLKLIHGISKGESVKKISLQNYNAGNAVNPGIPSIRVLNRFSALEELVIHGLCFQVSIILYLQVQCL